MRIRQIAHYQVKPEAVDRVKRAIAEFVEHVKANEPGTRLYMAWQQADDPTRFAHFFIFDDEGAQQAHGRSDAVKRFQSVYSPELVGGGVRFVDYALVAEKDAP
jgi:quinol monooxygenase YgiN